MTHGTKALDVRLPKNKQFDNMDRRSQVLTAFPAASKNPPLRSPTGPKTSTKDNALEDELPTDNTQSEFVAPDYEFDQFDMELGDNIGKFVCDGLDEATPGAAVDLVDDDFENELGTCASQQMTVQEALDREYRDISRLGIIQVAGDDRLGRKVIVFSACRLPANGGVDLQRLYE
ncbi:unnamed protein product [Dibothriocephalus latus]|uniref:Uncharacterized protein n=1 Tax=Dibothriocephalus latus TaxID=60516 RepID=A0A3P6SW11_DIBLA|nr:unnamed protein product [Dibothriocephalus latus]